MRRKPITLKSCTHCNQILVPRDMRRITNVAHLERHVAILERVLKKLEDRRLSLLGLTGYY
jgi:hypothetical protein